VTFQGGGKMKHPFLQKKVNGRLIREFSELVDSSELVWHRDRADRYVKVRSGNGWKLQVENSLPQNLVPGETYFIPKNSYHRVIKGKQSLVVEIQEVSKMKITERQLRRIIREQCDLAHDIEIADGGHVHKDDHHGEGSMARGQLARSAEVADMLKDMISDDSDLEEWVESKITKATDYLTTVLDYMKGKQGS
jgi:phage pi2 protein 07